MTAAYHRNRRSACPKAGDAPTDGPVRPYRRRSGLPTRCGRAEPADVESSPRGSYGQPSHGTGRTPEQAKPADTRRQPHAGAAKPTVVATPRRHNHVAVLPRPPDRKLYAGTGSSRCSYGPVEIADADRPLGTHVFTARRRQRTMPQRCTGRWCRYRRLRAGRMPGEPTKQGARKPRGRSALVIRAAQRDAGARPHHRPGGRHGKDRLDITPGGSVLISDHGVTGGKRQGQPTSSSRCVEATGRANDRPAVRNRSPALRVVCKMPHLSFHPPPRLPEDVSSPDPIHQGVKASFRGSLGRDPQSALQLAHFVDRRGPTGVIGTGPAGHALARPCAAHLTTAGTLRSPAFFVARLVTTTVPSDARCARLAFTIGLYEPRCRDTAAQTGLSCSGHLPARVLRPYPAETCRTCTSGLRHGRHGLRRDMTGSALRL